MGKCMQCTGCDSCNSACNSGQCYTCYSCQTDCQFCLICNTGCQTVCELEGQVLSKLEDEDFAFSPAPTSSSTRIGPCSSNNTNIFSRSSWNQAASYISRRHDHGTLVDGGDAVNGNTTDTFFTAEEFNRIARVVGWQPDPVAVDDVIYASLFTTLESYINSLKIDAGACDANDACTGECLSCNASCNTPDLCQGCQACVGCRGSCNTCNNGCSSCNKCNKACNSGENDCTQTT